MNQRTSSISAGRASLFLLIPAIAMIALSFGIRHFLATTLGGGSGEFQGINHFAPSLILVLFCIPEDRAPTSEDFVDSIGVRKNTICKQSQLPSLAVQAFVAFLEERGHVFTTIDDAHYMALAPKMYAKVRNSADNASPAFLFDSMRLLDSA